MRAPRPLPEVPSRVELSIRLPVEGSVVWDRVVTPAGINDELRPWLRMTVPRGLGALTIDQVPVGEPLGRSWILLFGALPVDYDDLRLVELEPRRRFLERSTTLSFRVWQHERIVEAVDGGCLVTDRLGFELRAAAARIPASSRIAAGIVGAIFAHRHRRLGRRFGAPGFAARSK